MKKSKISAERTLALYESIKENSLNIEVDVNSCVIINQSQFVKVTCNCCGHIQNYTLKSLINGQFQCTGCVNKKYSDVLLKDGYELLSRDKQQGEVRCLACGSVFKAHVAASVNTGNRLRCNKCLNIKYEAKAKELGYDYVCKDGQFVKLRCRNDGFEFNVAIRSLMVGYVSCSACQYKTYEDALAKKQCTLVSNYLSDKGKRRLIYSNSTGELFEATSGSVLNGRFATTKNGHWNQKHCVYVIDLTLSNGTKYCKIGTANDIYNRADGLKLCGEYQVYLLGKFDTRFLAYDFEFALHTEFKQYRLPSTVAEDFTGFLRSRKNKTGQYHRVKDGITEWFSSEVFDILSQRYNLE